MQINFTLHSVAPSEVLARRQVENERYLCPPPKGCGPIAIVVNGPSIKRHLRDIQEYPTIWAINSAVRTLRDAGIQSTLFSIDPMPAIAEFSPMSRISILTDVAHPDAIKNAYTLYMVPTETLIHGSTSATAAPHIALEAGYSHLRFFGCEGSFEGMTHADQDLDTTRLDVVCNGDIYETNPQMFIQCQALAPLLRDAPEYFAESSGGLLTAMVQDENYDIVRADEAFAAQLEYGQDDGIHE
jgi:hypothetical protein